MPSLDYNLLKNIKVEGPVETSYPTFVETGTWTGATILAMEKHFSKLHTIEVKKKFHRDAKSKYNGNKIDFHLGDSSKVLHELIPKLTGNTVFFLDGHWSSGNTGRGDKDCPLVEEVEAIHAKHTYAAIIIIDDYRLFGKGPNGVKGRKNGEDWSDIQKSTLLDILESRLEQIYHLPSNLHKKDRMVIHIRPMIDARWD